jgi:hypothetical protein
MIPDPGESLIAWALDLTLRLALLDELECVVRSTFVLLELLRCHEYPLWIINGQTVPRQKPTLVRFSPKTTKLLRRSEMT